RATRAPPRAHASPCPARGHAPVGGAAAGERRHLGRVCVRRRSHRGGARGRSQPHQGGEVISLLLVLAQAAGAVQGDPAIVAPGVKLERLFGDGFFTEGPAQAPDGSVYFSDITFVKASGYQAGHIWRWDPRPATTAVFRSPSGMSNEIFLHAQGRMFVTGGARLGCR